MGVGGNEKVEFLAPQTSVLEPQTRKWESWVYREEGEKQEEAPEGSQGLHNNRL